MGSRLLATACLHRMRMPRACQFCAALDSLPTDVREVVCSSRLSTKETRAWQRAPKTSKLLTMSSGCALAGRDRLWSLRRCSASATASSQSRLSAFGMLSSCWTRCQGALMSSLRKCAGILALCVRQHGGSRGAGQDKCMSACASEVVHHTRRFRLEIHPSVCEAGATAYSQGDALAGRALRTTR